MRIGIDFDNTLVCYDHAFYRAAVDRRLVPESLRPTKLAVRDRLRAEGREEAWTALQGFVYGEGIGLAAPFPGALAFLQRCVRDGIDVSIVSHKTRRPYLGGTADLHEAALAWLSSHGVFDRIGLPRSKVFLELTKEAKLARIGSERLTVFVDDLPELLSEPGFPAGVRRVLFAPGSAAAVLPAGIESAGSWAQVERVLFDRAAPA